jgi:hypothetical protein
VPVETVDNSAKCVKKETPMTIEERLQRIEEAVKQLQESIKEHGGKPSEPLKLACCDDGAIPEQEDE